MKVLSVFTICIAISSLLTLVLTESRPPHYSALHAMAEAAVQDCFEDAAQSVKVEITDEGFDELLKGSRDNLLRNTKCLRYCIMRKNGLFNDDSSIDTENFVQIFEKVHPQIEKEKLLKVLQKCDEETEKQTDNCERAPVAAMCVIAELKDEGVTDI